MAERIQEILARQMQMAKEAEPTQESRRRLRGLKDLVERVARSEARGWLTQTEQLIEVRRFHPDQLAGLKEIKWTFNMEALPVSVGQLLEDESIAPLFGFVNSSQQMRDVVPVARDVAVNPSELFILGSENLSFDDQCQINEGYVTGLRKRNLKTGTLDGIDFGLDHASVYAQFDFEHQKRFRGKKLFPAGKFARTIDETLVDPTFGPGLADVGRRFGGSRLDVDDWGARRGYPRVRGVSVATPAGNR